VPFGQLVRDARLNAGLTQEALAERSGVSVRAIQALERGRNTPHRDTVQRLADALGLGAGERARFEAAALPTLRRAVSTPAQVQPAETPPTNVPLQLTSFVGRVREMADVTAQLAGTRLLTLVGTGGVGKTRLALQVAAAVLDHYPQGIWLAELAPLADPGGVAAAVAGRAGAPDRPRARPSSGCRRSGPAG
jgi:transcriptional regulator with XRE-family HTH domain